MNTGAVSGAPLNGFEVIGPGNGGIAGIVLGYIGGHIPEADSIPTVWAGTVPKIGLG